MDRDKEESTASNGSQEPDVPSLEADKPISYWRLFRFSTPWEICILGLGVIMSGIKALCLPAVVIVYSEFTALLVDRTRMTDTSSKTYALPLFGGGKILTNETKEVNMQELYNDSISYGILLTIASIVMFISGIFSVDVFNMVALRQMTRLRMSLFSSIIRQNIGWHDIATKHNFIQNMTDDIEKIRDGISEKVGHFLYLILGFIITVGIAFGYGWKLTLAVSVYIPVVIILNVVVAKYQTKLTTREQESYSGAGNLVEEVLSSIRTVISFAGENKEAERYEKFLVLARKDSQRKGAFSGLSDGVLKAMLFLSCAGAFWYGVNLIIADRNVEDKEYTPAILMIAFFGIIVGADNIARTSPFLEAFSMARGCAASIFKVIDTPSEIDPLSTDGRILNYGLRGDIEFKEVFFRYPARPDVIVHRGLSFKVKSGQTVALVGFSGCGKSTCVQLLQRFYDPLFGSIMLDDLNLRKYNVQWLRSNMAIVGQEPILFQGTIAENIAFGKPNATHKEIEEAAKQGGVHEFITSLTDSYQTMIGERGVQLSGGQKQRIAIARALIQNPKILLLDEATSALDYQSEKLVQTALEQASKGRTTLVVSHRLSAVRGADKIVFLHDGKVAEEGTHDELMQLGGMYHKMVAAGEMYMPESDVKGADEDIADAKRQSIAHSIDESTLEKNQKINNVQFTEPYDIQNKNANIKLKKHSSDMIGTFKRIVKISRPEYCILLMGTIISILFGFTYPLFSVAFGEFYAALAEDDAQVALDRTAVLSICCLVLGFLTGVCCFLQTYLFNYAGVCMTTRVRGLAFRAILRQHMGFFDEEKNSVGVLSARLAGDAAGMQGAIGYPLSGIIQAISNFIISIAISFYYSWTLALLCLATCPFIVGSIIFEAKFMGTSLIQEKAAMEEASRIAAEAIANVRTIASLRKETYLIEKYGKEVQKMEKIIRHKLKYRGVINAAGQAFLFFSYAVALCYGGVLVSEGKVAFQDIIKVSETLLYGSMMLAQSLAFAPAFTAAMVAGQRIFQLLDTKPLVTSCQEKPRYTLAKQLNLFEGVRFHEIDFHYPTRKDIKILNGFNLDVIQGKTVALVGHSGCGKSTCIQLLLRFYDPISGSIHIDNNEIITDYTLEKLRSQMGFVSQEPNLFARTIAENIAYGDNSRNASVSEIMEAAKSANAHNFIMTLPNGYDTQIGSRGTQLSGGQKQRIAIARALIRNPKILLLDEATSALDMQSEQVVQQALDTACTGRTSIVIAHRLSTVQNADVICVLQNGRIVEQGNHHQLINRNGIYAKLLSSQKEG